MGACSASAPLAPGLRDVSFGSDCGQVAMGAGSSSTPLAPGLGDISFRCDSLIAHGAASERSSPAFTCKSSFSSFLTDPVSPTSNAGFSFRSCGESNGADLSSPVQSLPSFVFFSPPLAEAPGDPSCSGDDGAGDGRAQKGTTALLLRFASNL